MAVLTFDQERKEQFQKGFTKGHEIGHAVGVAEGRREGEAAALAKLKADAEAAQTLEEKSQQEWERSPALRSEFLSFEGYVAYKKGIESGHIKILGKK
jgi:flagellar biosynthesis/type III secretory pathway protein FliH